MEIITYILSGALEHRDSMGNGSVIRPGDVQRMSAGTGVSHSEFNPSDTEPVHLLQIWILPQSHGLPPSYEEKHFSEEERRGRLRLIASSDGREGSVTIHQDAQVYATVLDAGQTVVHALDENRYAWLQVARGTIRLNEVELKQGDGAAVPQRKRTHDRGARPGRSSALRSCLALFFRAIYRGHRRLHVAQFSDGFLDPDSQLFDRFDAPACLIAELFTQH